MDVFEDPVTNMVTATFELPGVSRDKIAIDVYDNRLKISGEVASYFGPNYGYILRERRTGPFVRTLQLPANIPVSHKRLPASCVCASVDR
jgi:HSP20 family protein